MASRFDNIQSRSIYVGASTNPDPALGNLIIDGSAGIGTTNPLNKLSISQGSFNVNATQVAILNSSNSQKAHVVYDTLLIQQDDAPTIRLYEYGENLSTTLSSDGGVSRLATTGILAFNVNGSSNSPGWNGLGGPEVMRMIANGNVGIGTTIPGTKLDVNGNISGNGLYYNGTFGGELRLDNSNGGGITYYADQNGHNFYTWSGSWVNRLSITDGGNIGISTTDPIASLDNQGSLGTYRQRGVSTMVTNILYADGTSATRYEIARATIDYNDWNETGIIEIELYEKYYSDGLKKRYLVTYGWGSGANKYLVEMSGTGANNFQVSIGTPVIISGDLRYLPIYVDLRYYNRCMAVVKTNRNLTTDNPPGMGGIWFNNAPAMTYISDFSADSAVYAGNVIGGNTIFPSGNVGIGTSTPGGKLGVEGTVITTGTLNSTSGSYSIDHPGVNTWKIGITNANNSTFHIGNDVGGSFTNKILNITESGNIGISVGNPLHKLTVGGNISISGGSGYLDFANGDVRLVNSGGLLSLQTYSVGTGLSTKMVVTGAGNVGIGTTAPDFNLTINGITGIQSSGTTKYHFAYYTGGFNFAQTGIADYRLFIQDGGNVGIGTGSPSNKLDVRGASGTAIRLSSDDNYHLGLLSWSTGVISLSAGGYGSPDLNFLTGGVERMRITNGGNIGINTTSPQARLDVNGDLSIGDGSNGNQNIQIRYGNFVSGYGAVRFYQSGSNLSTIHSFSTSWNSGNIFNSSSGAINITGNTGVTFGNWNDIDAAILTGGATYFKNNVGIGTTNPGYQLEVNGWIGASRYYPYSSNSTYIAGDGSGLTINGPGYLYAAMSGGSYFEGPMRLRNSLSNDANSYLQINGGTANLTYFAGTIGVGSTSIFHSATITSAGKLFLANTNNSDIGGAIYGYWDTVYQPYSGGLVFQSFNANGGTPYTMKDAMWLTGNGNLGVGTSNTFGNKVSINRGVSGTPSWDNATLELRSESGLTAALVFHRAGYTASTIYSDDGSIVINVGGERVRVATSGNVGIGTSNPQKPLEVISNVNDFVSVGVNQIAVGQWTGIHFGYREANSAYRKSAIVFERTDLTTSDAQGKIHILNGPQNSSGSATLSDAKLTIAENGNVGIGATSPTANLQVKGSDFVFGPTLKLTHDLGIGAPLDFYMYADAFGSASLNVSLYTSLLFNINSSEMMRIQPDGSIGIGTSAPDPSALLEVNSTRKGFLPPRMKYNDMIAIVSPAEGLVVFDATNKKLTVYTGAAWVPLH